MPDEDLRHYTIEELREKNERGDFLPASADAPTVDFDENFWRELEESNFEPVSSVEVLVKPATLDFFKDQSADAGAGMSRVLDAYARAQAKKAS